MNVIASAIGRFAVLDIDSETVAQANILTDTALERVLQTDTPLVPNSMPELIEQAIIFDKKLSNQLEHGPAREYMSERLIKESRKVVYNHQKGCETLLATNPSAEQLVSPDEIAECYGLPDMWVDALSLVDEEVSTWGFQTKHPDVSSFLSNLVSEPETTKLISFIKKDVLGLKNDFDTKIYITDDEESHHLYWAPISEGLTYVTPKNYNRAVQLSFDLPHNVAHLAHLAAMDEEQGVHRYTDSMDERAYFEAVAVLSEFIMVKTCLLNPESMTDMAQIFELPINASVVGELSCWLEDDRRYEFKLRSARLYADFLVTQGLSFKEILVEVSSKIGLGKDAAKAEATKYLPWTGLGAVYTSGYRKLLEAGIENIEDAITGLNGAITTWEHFFSENSIS